MRYLFVIFFAISFCFARAQNNTYYMLAGTYTSGKSDGIYVYKFNAQRGIVTLAGKTSGVENPSYLVVSPNQKYVYAVNENKGKPCEISAFSFDKAKGELKLINKQPAGEAPCYITIDSTGKYIVVAEYGSGISVYRTNPDGSLQQRTQTLQHDGYGIVYERQDRSHVHSVVFSPDQKYLFAADLGNDRLYQYKFNPADSTVPLSPADNPYYSLPDGSGPRHLIFHPNGKTAYLINELIGEVVVYSYNNGQLQEIQTIASTTAGGKYEQGSADIHITPNAKFLYTSNRGKANDITVYMITPEGKLNKTGRQPVNEHPRGFTIDPTGKFLLAASKDQNTIQIFAINPNFGLLEEVGQKIEVDMPVFLTMIPSK
jgi:6-phosphogluconolactonase